MFPILEFDPALEAVIEPRKTIARKDVPAHAVLCFFHDVLAGLLADGRARKVFELRTEMGPNPVYQVDVDGRPVLLVQPGVGAPLAAAFLEELIALGCSRFIACGGAGVLDGSIALGHLVVPTHAVRDEGTSYHYLPPSREVEVDPRGLAAIEEALREKGHPFLRAKTWTTDAIYRETVGKVARRREEGCLTVEMEAAALFAVARFRDVPLGQILYGGDDVSGATWDSRHWDKSTTVREQVLWLGIDACLRL